jgi:hypothetical protein
MRIYDLEAQIWVNGQPATEYIDPDFEQEPVEGEALGYIETAAGSTFEFRCHLHPTYVFATVIDYLSFWFFVDGCRVKGKIIRKKFHLQGKRSIAKRKGYRIGSTERKSTFAKVNICDIIPVQRLRVIRN